MPPCSQRHHGELGRLPAPGISAQWGHLLRPPAPPSEELRGSLFSFTFPDWQSPEISRTATAVPGPWRSLFLIVSQFLPPSSCVTEMHSHGE